jgi:hypothetical protein
MRDVATAIKGIEMSEQADKPDAAPGWYPDPDQASTQRYWDGSDWTDQRAPMAVDSSAWREGNAQMTDQGKFVLGLLLAGLGAAIAILGVFLSEGDTESSIHIAKNTLIQHWEGGVVVGVAVIGFLVALRPSLRPLNLLAGASLIVFAVLAGTHLPIQYRNEFSHVVAGHASPGAGIWTVGVGGALLVLSAFFSDWKAFGNWMTGRAETQPGKRRKRSWEEIMSGQYYEDDDQVS